MQYKWTENQEGHGTHLTLEVLVFGLTLKYRHVVNTRHAHDQKGMVKEAKKFMAHQISQHIGHHIRQQIKD